MNFYLIRHKESGKFMPLMRKNRGYSHWNPSKSNIKLHIETEIPRFLKDDKQAHRVIAQWNANPNARWKTSMSYYGEEDCYVDINPDGRKKEDLEIVAVTVEEKK